MAGCCRCLQDVPGATVTACAARDPERAQIYADDHGIATAHDSYEALVSDPNVDIVCACPGPAVPTAFQR